jgi:hypothetical protein
MLRHRRRSTAIAGAAAVILVGAGLAGAAGTAAVAATGPVSPTPASGTPELSNTGSTQTVRQLAQCGNYMYAVGAFTTIKRYSTTYTRNNVFRFSATGTYAVDTQWNPNVNGVVNSITFNSNCSGAYIGGKFTSVGGTAVKDIAEISTSGTGAVVTSFAHSASGQVETLARYGSHILTGGYFTSINNSTADPYMASLDATTGKDDGFLQLHISGNYHYCNSAGTQCTASNPTRVYNQQLSNPGAPDGGTLDLVEGDFTMAGGLPRQQIFMLDLATAPVSVTGWTSPEWDGSDPAQPYQCSFIEPFYLQAAAWSPDDSTIYVDSTGYKPWNLPAGTYPRSGPCDMAAAYPATQTSVTHEWINYTGCDSLYAAAADASAAYFGGHERWSQNPSDCDAQGPTAVPDPGMEGLVPATGLDMLNSGGSGLYTRSRGQGADDMLTTSAGLWIASDSGAVSKSTGTFSYSQTCGGVTSHSGICFLPYPS